MPQPKANQLVLEIRDQSVWRSIGTVRLLGTEAEGLKARTEFCYDLDYATEFADRTDFRAVSCLAPVSFEPKSYEGWPPFLLDLFPQGATLHYIVDHYRIPDQPSNYWRIIKTAALNPPGNLRVVSSAIVHAPPVNKLHGGFERSEVLAKGADFLEYMIKNGAPVAGTTGASGAAPKFLLRKDLRGRFHADGVLADEQTKDCFLVKFPRGKKRDDIEILRCESAYIEVARLAGLDVFAPIDWEKNCLFVTRFDRRRPRGKKFQYLGLESFYSMVGLPEFGSRLLHESYIAALAIFSSQPTQDIVEYVLRDFLNMMLGNTDNPGRNSSLLKGDSWVRLAPMYDLAPMKFDPEGIVRNTRWGDATEMGEIDSIVAFLETTKKGSKKIFDERLKAFAQATSKLDSMLKRLGVPQRFIEGTQAEREETLKTIRDYLKGKGSR